MITLRTSVSPAVLIVLLAVVIAFTVSPLAVSAQTATAPPPATRMTPAPGGSAGDPGSGGLATAVVLIIALFVIVGVAVKIFDLKRKREAEAVHVQAQIADALLREETLFGLPVTPTAHVPLLKGTPVTIEVDGQVPRPDLREDVLRVVRREAGSIRPDFRIDDRMAIIPETRVA